MHDTPRIRLWCDWLLVVAALMMLCAPVFLAIDAAYRSDHAVLYWLLIVHNYPDGIPAGTVIGLVVIAAALLGYWISLRLLARAGMRPLRALATLVLTVVASVFAALTLILSLIMVNAGPIVAGAILLVGGLVTGISLLGLGALVVVGTPKRLPTALVRPLALAAGASALAVVIAPLALFAIGEGIASYTHLASASYQDHRYYLALEQTPSDGAWVVLFRCDAQGVMCHEVDSLIDPSPNGWLSYDRATRTITVSEKGHPFMTYQTGDLLNGP